MAYETILVETDDAGVSVLTLNRPQKKNAMNPRMHREVAAALDGLRYDPACKVLVVTGAGESFSSGMDLKEFFVELKPDPAEYDRVTRLSTEWRGRTIRLFPKPTVAMVNGYCFGGAMPIVESCDVAIAAEDAIFGLSEINYKMFPGGSVTRSLMNVLQARQFLFYAMTGRPFDGRKAAEIGMVTMAMPRAALREETMKIAREIAAKDASALTAVKEMYRFSGGLEWDQAMSYASAMEAKHTARQNDAFRKEGIGDFLKGEYKPGLESHENRKKA